MIEVMKSKLHCVTVTEANLNYMGSITIDEDLMDAANLIAGEKVQVLDNNNGERFETYIIKGERGSGCICLNGAAALCMGISVGFFFSREKPILIPPIPENNERTFIFIYYLLYFLILYFLFLYSPSISRIPSSTSCFR